MIIKDLPPTRSTVDIDGLMIIADRAQGTLTRLRDDLLEPWPRKAPPTITGARLAKLCKIDGKQLNYLCRKGEISAGDLKGNGRSREFSLSEAQEIIRKIGPYKRRPEGADGIVICVGNFKGGVGKTTLTVAMAQAFTQHGHSVCLIDLDPQASTTTLMGYVPDAEVTEEMTVMPVVYGEQSDLSYAPIQSYWDGIDLIPSSPSLFGADYFLPNKQSAEPDFQFWKVLDLAMEPIRKKYDIVIIDTPPTLSYLAIASFMATDGMVIPLPPETLDYASSTQFFRQFAELFKTLRSSKSVQKQFEFIKIVLSKVKQSAQTTDVVKSWIKQTYHELLGTAEILETDLVKNASAEFKTLYDLTTYDGSVKTYNRAIEAFDSVVDELEIEVQNAWAHRSQAQKEKAHG